MKQILTVIAALIFSVQSGSDISKSVLSDISLIVPGIGAEKTLLNEKAQNIVSRKGYPDSIADFPAKKELFYDIFNVKSSNKVFYNKIYYYRSKSLIVFILNQEISAIAGLSNNRITMDFVDLSNGVEYFIFRYGNSGFREIVRKRDKMYIYSQFGIALVDDRSDDIIDMYIIFMPNK